MGAGLSGLSAAINLAKAGYNVDVFEKRNDSGKRFGGDIAGLENWSVQTDVIQEFRSMNVKANFDCDPFKTMYLSDGKKVLKNTSDKPIFYLVKRGAVENSLDQGLKKQALDCGVNIHYNSNVKKEDMDIISIGPIEDKPSGVLQGILFETSSDDIAAVIINKKVSNKGYSYLLITKGLGTICSVNFYELNLNTNMFYKKTNVTISKLFDIDIKNKKKISGIGCFKIKPHLIENKKIFTGEAAGLQDVLWGFGMRYAINSGFYAALSAIENKDYDKLIKQKLSRRHKTSVANRYLCEKYENQFYSYLMEHAKKSDKWTDLLHQEYNPTLRSRIIYPFAQRSLSRKYNDNS